LVILKNRIFLAQGLTENSDLPDRAIPLKGLMFWAVGWVSIA
jgi:hypothetical protein